MTTQPIVQIALPKGRMLAEICALLKESGCPAEINDRNYRVTMCGSGFAGKLLKPQSIVEMLAAGRRDVGFTGADWVAELDADLIELMDTGLNPVEVVVACPEAFLEEGQLPRRPMVVASEYARLAKEWMRRSSIEGTFVRSWGATEVLPPDDADCIIDNTATGATLRANRLQIVEVLMRSSTRLYASRQAMENLDKRRQIESLVLVLKSVIEARQRVMVELNVQSEFLDSVLQVIPSMRQPTVAPLSTSNGVAVKSAVKRSDLFELLPKLKSVGATDLAVSRIDQIVA